MNKLWLVFVCCLWLNSTFAETRFIFLNVQQAKLFLTERDSYTDILSPLDLSLYHSTKETISIEDHLDFLKSTPQEWTEQEKASLSQKIALFTKVVTDLHLKLSLPSEVLLIKTNGEDAFHSHYTRRNGIIFPAAANGEIATDLATFYHEMFHILSRHNPKLGDELFALIGFSPVTRVEIPAVLEKIRTTNPDAFFYDHAVTINARGANHVVVPFMYSAIKQEEINGPVDESLVYKLGLLELSTLNEEAPVLYKVSETNYKEIVQANSHYYIHPEEILAEDFKLLLLQNTPDVQVPVVKYPAVLEQLKNHLREP